MMNLNTQLRFIVTCVITFLVINVYGQYYNPEVFDFKAIPGEVLQVSIASSKANDPVTLNVDDAVIDIDPIGYFDDMFHFNIRVLDTEYRGMSSFYFEYQGGPKRNLSKRFSKIEISIEDSYVEAIHDYKSIQINQEPVVIDVLNNDISTHPNGLQIDQNLPLVQNGVAFVQNNKIVFQPEADFVGMAYVNYIAKDQFGSVDDGTVSICIFPNGNMPEYDEISLTTTRFNAVAILLPGNGFELSSNESPTFGSLHSVGDDVMEYTPSGIFLGQDEFVLDNGDGISRRVTINIVESEKQSGPLRKDVIYTEINHPVTFNIFENDIVETDIISLPKGLTLNNNGTISYDPKKNFSGIKMFSYTTSDGVDFYNGTIEIVVNNFIPEARSSFDFVTAMNDPILINYSVPIDDYTFEVFENASNGSAYVLSSFEYTNDRCDHGISYDEGYQKVRYQPNSGFAGEDSFVLKYCPEGKPCVEVNINVYVDEYYEDCYCVGTKCVWSGDFNGDGKVAMNDLLALGYHFGTSGPSRKQTSNDWIGQFADDWGALQIESGVDLKYIDANGDGIISMDDVTSFDEHYDQFHNIVASEVLMPLDYPFFVVPRQSSVEVGDLLQLDIVLGTDANPVTDMHGISFDLNLSPQFIDSSSVSVEFKERSWLANNSPMIHMFKQPVEGRISVGTTRTTSVFASGGGITHTIGLIVEEEIDGLREDQVGPKDIEIDLGNIIMTNGNGQRFTLPEQKITIILLDDHIDEDEIEDTAVHVITYPNPAKDLVNFHANGKDIIKNIQIFNSSGNLVFKERNLNTNHFTFSSGDFPQGMYIAKLITHKGAVTSKFQVIKN